MTHADTTRYDELAYGDLAFYHTHPSNLAVVATLCGLTPPSIANCRVLELGCGTGFNLLAMAHSLPQARFVGVDLSARQIEHGQKLAADVNVGPDRLALHAMSLTDLDDSFGTFDYIIAHGVYSWVPAPVRDALLTACRRHLAPNGIAYVSYNILPGWNLRGIIRDLLFFHAPDDGPPLERVRQARAALGKMVESLPGPATNYSQFLKNEYNFFKDLPDFYIYHEFFAESHYPVQFSEFMNHAAHEGLQFIAEARFGTSSFAQQGPYIEALNAAGNNLLRREQYSDYVRSRSFRQSVLCHAAATPTWSPTMNGVTGLFAYAKVEWLGEVPGEEGVAFRVDGEDHSTSDPVEHAVLQVLSENWPRPVPFPDLLERAARRLPTEGLPRNMSPRMIVGGTVFRGYAENLWSLMAYSPPYAAEPDDPPHACPLARHRAGTGTAVTNRLHRTAPLSTEDLAVLTRLDGQNSRRDLAVSLGRDLATIDASLNRLAESAVLV